VSLKVHRARGYWWFMKEWRLAPENYLRGSKRRGGEQG